MNVNEYGIQLQFGVSFNMAAYASLTFNFTKPDGTVLTVPGTIGNTAITTPLGSFAAYTWASYTFQMGDVNQVGIYKVRLIYQDVTPAHLISSPGSFTVSA